MDYSMLVNFVITLGSFISKMLHQIQFFAVFFFKLIMSHRMPGSIGNKKTLTNRVTLYVQKSGDMDFLDQVRGVKGFLDQLYHSVDHLDQLHKY